MVDMHQDFANYRQILVTTNPPAVPIIGASTSRANQFESELEYALWCQLGVYITTLAFINDTAEDKFGDQMINFRKRHETAEVIRDLKRWQAMRFGIPSVGIVLSFLKDSFERYVDGVDYSERLWNLSLEREPMEREDQRISLLTKQADFM